MEWWVRHSIEHLKKIVPRNQKEGGLTLGLDTDLQKMGAEDIEVRRGGALDSDKCRRS
jgi:hypothetical protein